MEKCPLLLFSLLVLALSLPIHARESQFFAKTTRLDSTEDPAAALPPQSHTGYGLYGRDPSTNIPSNLPNKERVVNNIPSTFADVDFTASYDNYKEGSKANNIPSSFPNAEFSTDSYDNKKRGANNIPSSFANADFTASYDNYKEGSKANNVPSSFPNAEFSTDSYDNKKRSANNIPSSFANADLAASYDNYKERSKANNVPEFPTETYENKEFSEPKNDDIPMTFSDEEFKRYESAKVPNYSSYGKQYGMSDTRFLENGKYFYDVNAEKSSQGYEPMKESSERYGSYGNKNEYPSNEENEELPEEFVP